MLKLKNDLLGFSPLFFILAFLFGRTTGGASKYGGYPFYSALGLSIIIFSVIVFIFSMIRTYNITRYLLLLVCILALMAGIIVAIVGRLKGMYILITACFLQGIYGILLGKDIAKERKENIAVNKGENKAESNNQIRSPRFKRPDRRQIKGAAILVCILASGILLHQTWQFDDRTELEFTISKDTMAEKELVLYWVRQTMEDPQAFVDVLRDTNTVLSLQGNPDLFTEIDEENENKSVDAANLIRLCNEADVKVEVWPVRGESLDCDCSMSSVDCMPTMYQYFKSWITKYNITVDYYAFDIENYVALSDFDTSAIGQHVSVETPEYWTLKYIYDISNQQAHLRANRSDWDEKIKKQQALVDLIIADGIIPRGTIQPAVWDNLDGDYNDYKKNNMQSYEIEGYEYLSAMYYRSCEWGNDDSTYIVYQSTRIMDSTTPYEKTAVCIGCINYCAYETDAEVANDVWMSVGAGADSVRLFLGDSWVYSAPTEAEGLTNLRSMLELCRAGGTGYTEYSAQWESEIMNTILLDVLGDL